MWRYLDTIGELDDSADRKVCTRCVTLQAILRCSGSSMIPVDLFSSDACSGCLHAIVYPYG